MKNHRIVVNRGAAHRHGIKIPAKANDQSISPNQAARILGVTGEAVKVYIYNRKLPAIKLRNGYWRILKRDLEHFIRSRLTPPLLKVLVFPTGGLTQMIAAAIEQPGREPVQASSFPNALLNVTGAYPLAAIIDLTAGDEGWALAERIKRMKGHGTMPVLLIAPAALCDADVDRALAIGAKAVFTMPVSTEQVASELTGVMAKL